MNKLLLTFAAMFLAGGVALAQPLPQKKLIELGWDKPDTASLRKNLKEMEKSPFDGVIIGVTGKQENGDSVSVRNTFNNVPWKKEWFAQSVADLKAISPTKLTHNFIQVCTYPGNVDWFNDAGWKNVVDHWRIAAWIAKEGNLKGIAFDPEPYHKDYQQLNYYRQANRKKYSFTQYQEKARQRGREVMQAVTEIYPDIVILTTWMNSANGQAINSPNPGEAIRVTNYNLYPAFINGWLDAAPPAMTFVDGNEYAYLYNSDSEFLKMGNAIRNNALSLVAPENRRKYMAQVQSSSGIYLDSYTVPATSRWHIDRKGQAPLTRLKSNLSSALNAANEYVWVYGERNRWWPTENKSVTAQYWNDAIPGINAALEGLKTPQGTYDVLVAQLENKENLIKNGNFQETTGEAKEQLQPDWKTEGMPANWSSWQYPRDKGTFVVDATQNHSQAKNGALRINQVANGVLLQAIAVKPGEQYAVQSFLKQQGTALSYVRVRWQTANKRWLGDGEQDTLFFADNKGDQTNWFPAQGVVAVPDEAAWMILTLCAGYQENANDTVWFDDVAVYKVK